MEYQIVGAPIVCGKSKLQGSIVQATLESPGIIVTTGITETINRSLTFLGLDDYHYGNLRRVFQNYPDGKMVLPERPLGYYRYSYLPSDNHRIGHIERVIIGEEGDAYYTADHYSTFIKITI